MEVKFNLLCLPVQDFDLVLRSVNNPWYVWGCTESGTFPWGHTRGWRVFFSSGPRWPFFTPLISALGRLVYMIFRNTSFLGCSGTEFLEHALFSNGSVCHSSHQWGAFVQRNVFKWLLNAAQSLHQDLMPSSPPGCCNRCVEASIEPFVTLDNLLPSRFIRTVTIQSSSCASLASDDCFPARALAYVPTTHLLFHRQWQVGTSWGTVMTDPPCLSSADGVNHADRHFCFVAKSKNKLYVCRSMRSATNSQRYNKSLVYLMWMAHQAIIKPSSRPSLNLFLSLSPKRRRKIYLSRAARAEGFWDGLNWRPHHSVSLNIHDKVSLLDWDTALWIPLITCASLRQRVFEPKQEKEFSRGETRYCWIHKLCNLPWCFINRKCSTRGKCKGTQQACASESPIHGSTNR